jgi:hypothetical protein
MSRDRKFRCDPASWTKGSYSLIEASGVGYVTRFAVRADFLNRYQLQKVGGAIHTEYWIPAEDLPAFNGHIVGSIAVTAEFR